MAKLNTLVCMGVLCLAAAPLYATGAQSQQATGSQSPQSVNTEALSGEQQNARETVREAARVVRQIKAEPELRDSLQRAKAIYIVPDYSRASPEGGVAGDQGVLVVNREGEWSGPAFFNIGMRSLGIAAGAEAGAIAFLIMSDEAMQGFRSGAYNFSLNADVGLTIINGSALGQISAGKDIDVIAWSDTEDLYGDLATSVSSIFWADDANQAYYARIDLTMNDILKGTVPDMEASNRLKAEFSALEMAPSSSGILNPSDKSPQHEPPAKSQGSEY